MVHNGKTLIAGLMSATLLTSGAVWAAAAPSANETSSPHVAADNDFGKLSRDGSHAFRDVILTRLAIFDGRVGQAKKLVNEADQDFAKAKTDETVFTKAEADLRAPRNQPSQSARRSTGAQ